MSDDRPLKSAYELAMERLRKEDRKQGIEEPQRLSRRQKEAIAKLRQEAQAKLAELEILHDKRLAAVAADPEKHAVEEEHYQIDRRRVETKLETEVARIKRGKPSRRS